MPSVVAGIFHKSLRFPDCSAFNIGTMSYFVYILECSDKTLYTGTTGNIKKRIEEHNGSRAGAKYTRTRRPVKLVYAEICPTSSVALKREAEIKRLSRAKKLLLIADSTDSLGKI